LIRRKTLSDSQPKGTDTRGGDLGREERDQTSILMENGRIGRMTRLFKRGEILMEIFAKIISESMLQEIGRKNQGGGKIGESMMKTSLNEGRILEDTTRSETPGTKSGTVRSDLFGGKREKTLIQRPIRTKGRDAIEGRIITTVTLKHTRRKRILGMGIGNGEKSIKEEGGPLASEAHDAKRT